MKKVFGKYTCANEEKLNRAIYGTVMAAGEAKGGVGENASDAEVLAAYDRLGGLILKDGKYKVKSGSFFDLKKQKAIAKPSPILVFHVNGEVIEVDADEPLPLEVQAAQIADDKKKKRAAKKRAKKSNDESEEETESDEEDTNDDEEDTNDDGELA